MTHYVLIDEYTDIVWGDAEADTPEEACRLVDEANLEHGRAYRSIGREPFQGRSGYHVYEAPADWPNMSENMDERVPLVCRVLIDEGAPL